MLRKLAALVAAALMGTGVALAVDSPALANLSYCYTSSICFYNSTSPWPAGQGSTPGGRWVMDRDSADTPRNTCFTGFGTQSTFTVINNSQYRWYLFRTTSCGGSHIEVPPFTEMHTPDGWAAIRGVMRTSTLTLTP